LTHSVDDRPKFEYLQEDAFILHIEKQTVDVAGWYGKVLAAEEARQQS